MKNHDYRKTFSGRFSDKIAEKFNEITIDNDFTDSQVVEAIIDQAQQNANSEELENLRTMVDNLKPLEEQVAQLEATIADKNAEIKELQEKLEEIQTEADDWKQEAFESGRKLQGLQLAIDQPKKGSYVVQFPPMADELLQVTVNRLREKLGVPDLTPAQLLQDLFVKYTAKRPADFAYPFVIGKDEFKVIMSRYSK